MTEYKEVVGTGGKAVTFDQVELDEARDYSCEDADVTLQLSSLLLPKLEKEGFQELYEHVEMPLVVVLAKMEMNGVKIDVGSPREISRKRWRASFNRRWTGSIAWPVKSSTSTLRSSWAGSSSKN